MHFKLFIMFILSYLLHFSQDIVLPGYTLRAS